MKGKCLGQKKRNALQRSGPAGRLRISLWVDSTVERTVDAPAAIRLVRGRNGQLPFGECFYSPPVFLVCNAVNTPPFAVDPLNDIFWSIFGCCHIDGFLDTFRGKSKPLS